MNTRKFLIGSVAAMFLFTLVAAAKVEPVKANVFNDTNWGELIVLDSLFDGGFDNDFNDLAGLIAVDRITGDNVGDNDLGELLILNNLFSGGLDGNFNDLAGLIVIDNLFR